MVTQLGWGIIGTGWVARDYVAPALAAAGNARLVAVHDRDAAAMDAIAGDVVRCGSLVTLLATPGVQAVYVATPNDAHRAVTESAARAGHAVLCEKPMAAAAADAAAMLAACRTAGVVYATAFDQRFHAAHRALRTLIADGALGRVTAIRIVYACWLPGDWAADNWRVDRTRAGGGAFIDLAPHGLDLACMLTNDRVIELTAIGQHRVHGYAVEDGAMLLARTEGDILIQAHVAYNYPETLPRRRLEVVGTHGLAVAVDTMGQVPGGRLTLTDAATGVTRDVPVPDAARSPFTAQIEAFSAAVLAGHDFGFRGEDDLALMRLIAAAQPAARVHAEAAD